MSPQRLRSLALVLGGLLLITGLVVFALRGWLGTQFRARLDSELANRRIHLDYRATDFNLFSGLVLNDVTLFRTAERKDKLLQLNRIDFRFKLSQILFDKTSRSLRASTSESVLTVFHEDQPYRMEKLDSQLVIGASSLRLIELTGHFAGLNLDLAGEVAFPPAARSKGAPVGEAPPGEGEPGGLAGWDLSPVADLAKALKIQSSKAFPTLKIRFVQGPDGTSDVRGTLSGRGFSWDSLAIDSVAVDFEQQAASKPPVFVFSRMELGYGGGKLTGVGAFDTGSQEVRLEKVESRLNLLDLANELQGQPEKGSVRFIAPPQVFMSGTIPLDGIERSVLDGQLQGEEGVVVELPGGKSIVLEHLALKFALRDGSLNLSEVKGRTLGGGFGAKVAIKPFDEVVEFRGTIELENLSLAEISELAGSKAERVGRLHGKFTGGGPPDLEKLDGHGTLEITEADFVSIPIFRKLQPVLAAMSSGNWQGKQKGATATSSYTLKDAVLLSEDIVVKGGFFEIGGRAQVNFATEELSARALVKTRGAMQLISELAGKVLELEAKGTFGKFTWKLKNLPTLGNGEPLSNLPKSVLTESLRQLGVGQRPATEAADDPSRTAKDVMSNLPLLKKPKPSEGNPPGGETPAKPPKAKRPPPESAAPGGR